MPAVVHGFVDGLVGELIQLFHDIAAHIHPVSYAEDVHQSRLADLSPHELRSERKVMQEAGELAGRGWETLLLFVDVAFQRHEFCCLLHRASLLR